VSRFWQKQRNRIIYYDGGFTAHAIPGLAQWLDAADASTITLDGSSNISEIRDKSGFGLHGTQSDGSRRPSYPANVQNGLPGVLFDSVDDALTLAGPSTNPATTFIVHRWNGGLKDSRLASNRAVNGMSLGINASSGWNLSFVREGIAWTNSGFSPGSGTNRIYRISHASGTSAFWTWTGGTETQRQSVSLSGNIATSEGISYPGHLFEMIRYNATLTTEQANSVYAYLSAKWAIA
jgi:hypothetical protein